MSDQPTDYKGTVGTKDDRQKLRYDLVPFDALDAVVEILGFGAGKYGDRNWEEGMHWGRMFGAALRHLKSWWLGEEIDKDSGKTHLAHAACCVLMLLSYELRKKGIDDRPKS